MTGFYSALGGLAIILGLVAWLYWQVKRDGKVEQKLREEMDDAEAARREWDIERRARNAVDHISNDAASVLNDPHNRDRKKSAV